ncbi:hypothetical protein HNY73_020023 [Argiope bruennichi]|uniref:Uncharacterized protein n=1 Tax=Argiope bruennichi TaxID=94029 RepID=A0A8T0E991_ARGBR|nr:hypothetical protein HNY73_020023 [Argiope bruennichi]
MRTSQTSTLLSALRRKATPHPRALRKPEARGKEKATSLPEIQPGTRGPSPTSRPYGGVSDHNTRRRGFHTHRKGMKEKGAHFQRGKRFTFVYGNGGHARTSTGCINPRENRGTSGGFGRLGMGGSGGGDPSTPWRGGEFLVGEGHRTFFVGVWGCFSLPIWGLLEKTGGSALACYCF